MSNDYMDGVLLDMFPVVAVPPSGQLAKPSRDGQRYLVGNSGLFREVSTPWLYAVYPIASISGLATPFGEVKTTVTIGCSMPPRELWAEFLAEATKALPNECAAVFLWNQHTGLWRFAMRESIAGSPSRVDYREPSIEEDEIVVVDVHSHASYGAGFSPRDDRDDAGGIKIAAVFGKVDTPTPEIALRLVCLDNMIALRLDGDQIVVDRVGVMA